MPNLTMNTLTVPVDVSGVITDVSFDIEDAKVRDIIADAFSEDISYEVGDYCIQEGTLYKCNTAHNGEWINDNFTATTVADELKAAIGDEGGGGDAILGSITITQNGIYNPQDDNLDGYDSVIVNTPESVFGEKIITENGTYRAHTDDFDGYSKVTVKTPVKKLGSKTITGNGIYIPSSDFLDGYDYIIVNVPTGTLPGVLIKPLIGTAERIGD